MLGRHPPPRPTLGEASPAAGLHRRRPASLTPLVEAFNALRSNLVYLEVDRPLRSILVTSPTGGEGRSTVALNLAAALAASGEHVILVDADLRARRSTEFPLTTVPG